MNTEAGSFRVYAFSFSHQIIKEFGKKVKKQKRGMKHGSGDPETITLYT